LNFSVTMVTVVCRKCLGKHALHEKTTPTG
jgi:hypothetical protein